MLHMYCTCQVSQKKFTWSQQEHKSSSVHMPCLVQAADMLHLPGLPKNKQTSKVVEMTWKALRQLSCIEACSRTIMAVYGLLLVNATMSPSICSKFGHWYEILLCLCMTYNVSKIVWNRLSKRLEVYHDFQSWWRAMSGLWAIMMSFTLHYNQVRNHDDWGDTHECRHNRICFPRIRLPIA